MRNYKILIEAENKKIEALKKEWNDLDANSCPDEERMSLLEIEVQESYNQIERLQFWDDQNRV